MNHQKEEYYLKEIITKTIENLRRRNIGGYYVENTKELMILLDNFLNEGETIGCGDSVTLEETGVYQMLRSGKYLFLDKYAYDLTTEMVVVLLLCSMVPGK